MYDRKHVIENQNKPRMTNDFEKQNKEKIGTVDFVRKKSLRFDSLFEINEKYEVSPLAFEKTRF